MISRIEDWLMRLQQKDEQAFIMLTGSITVLACLLAIGLIVVMPCFWFGIIWIVVVACGMLGLLLLATLVVGVGRSWNTYFANRAYWKRNRR